MLNFPPELSDLVDIEDVLLGSSEYAVRVADCKLFIAMRMQIIGCLKC